MVTKKLPPIFWVIIGLIIVFAIGFIVIKKAPKYYSDKKIEQAATNYSTGKDLASQGKYQEATKYLQKAVNSESDNSSYIKELAVAKYNNKDYQGAINLYGELIKINSTDAFAYNGIANSYRDWAKVTAEKQKEYQDNAVTNYNNAISANKNYTISYNNLALLYQDMGNKDQAIKTLQDGVKQNPDSQELKNSLKIMQGK